MIIKDYNFEEKKTMTSRKRNFCEFFLTRLFFAGSIRVKLTNTDSKYSYMYIYTHIYIAI
jgi:hypothetical protein